MSSCNAGFKGHAATASSRVCFFTMSGVLPARADHDNFGVDPILTSDRTAG